MAPRTTTSALLGAASAATSIAREAVDGVPLAKQVIGSIARVLELAEKADRNREALRALAEQALAFAEAIPAALNGQQLNPVLSHSLEKILKVAESVEALMTKHLAKVAILRAFAYAFTVAPKIERLVRELSDAVQIFGVIAQVDTNLRVHENKEITTENAQYNGEFRLLRHCDVTKLELINEDVSSGVGMTVKYHRARVGGEVLVVCYLEGGDQASVMASPIPETALRRMEAYDRILERSSTVHRSHPHVAQLYGRSRAPLHSRFTVLKSGLVPAEAYIGNALGRNTTHMGLAESIAFIYKLVDALRHLESMGISWSPRAQRNQVLMDQNREPTIGHNYALERAETPYALNHMHALQSRVIFWDHSRTGAFRYISSGKQSLRWARAQDSRIDRLLSAGGDVDRRESWTVPRSSLPPRLLCNSANAEHLMNMAEQVDSNHHYRHIMRMLAALPAATYTIPRLTLTARCEAETGWGKGSRDIYCLSLMEVFEDSDGQVITYHKINNPRITLQAVGQLFNVEFPDRKISQPFDIHIFETRAVQPPCAVPNRPSCTTL